MAERQETIADIIAEMRFHAQQNIDAEKDKPEYGFLTVEGRCIQSYADRLEAAHRREVQNALDAGGFVEASRKNEQVGNAAKLREAALAIRADILKRRSENCWYATDSNILEKIDAALAAPPRNCDRFANAVEAMAELKRVHSYCAKENRRCLEDCPDCGKEWCSLAWLFAPATESEAQA